ncbi:MAG TPA: neutral/alkaline non-lysosomal ceramidase N-terminal domain-containing protein [Sedimentisphaerales bacterium]|nr:neutral/alkaline non-lysosomal ceramidase N-terminal domain-containing protein [Sedimentisphaerales bacterium]
MNSFEELSRRRFLGRTLKLGAAGFAASCAATSCSSTMTGPATESPWQIGCYTRPWADYDYRVALDAIVEAGFKYAGLMTTKSKTGLIISVDTTLKEAERVGQEIKKRSLGVLSVYGGGIPVAKSLKAGIDGLKKLIDNCAACDAKNLLMGGTGDNKLYEVYYKAIAECCDYAAEKGVGISIKPHGGLNATGPQCRKTIEMVGHRNFRIWYDPGNIFFYSDGKLDPVDDAATVDGLVTGMCVKDYRHPKDVSVTPGTGQVDFPAVLARLKNGGFTHGPLVIECLDRGDAEQTLAQARKTRLFLEELTGQKTSSSRKRSVDVPELTAGLAVIDITPPIPYRMSGYFNERLSTGISNPLHAKAIVLGQGKERAALVFCDIIGISPDVSLRVRRQAAEKTGIPAANILIAATHSHTGPLYFGALRKHFHDLAVAEQGNDPYEKVDYPSELVSKIVKAITQAKAAARPVRLKAGTAEQQGLSFNRRFHMKDGTVRFNPGVLNPDIVRPAGPIDPGVGIVFLNDAESRSAAAALVNFTLHLDTVGGTEYAPDYPFYLEQSLRETYGDEFVLLFGTGTCGDINHIDVTKKERLKTDYIGNTLAQTVKAKSGSLETVAEPALAVRSEVVEVPLQKYGPEKVAWAHENIKKVGTSELSFIKQVEAYKILALEMRNSKTIGLEVQVFRLSNDVAVVGLPGEVFVDLGLDIKRASPFATTLVIELCQDAPGYIPTKKAFAEGSYETVNSRIAPGGGEMMVDAAVRLLKELGSV